MQENVTASAFSNKVTLMRNDHPKPIKGNTISARVSRFRKPHFPLLPPYETDAQGKFNKSFPRQDLNTRYEHRHLILRGEHLKSRMKLGNAGGTMCCPIVNIPEIDTTNGITPVTITSM